jgi:hypothetical protein
MSMDPRRWRGAGGAAAAAPDLAPPSPGKVTLTQRLTRATRPPAPSAAPPSLQADRGAVLPLEPFALHEIAAAGVGDRAEGLPHLPALQASFGSHDVSDVRAHTDGAAVQASADLGATAFATGEDVAFGGTPDLHTAAHEAAHVVQQRAGVHLAGGVGEDGDPYEATRRRRGRQGRRRRVCRGSERGELRPDDATHIALANAWPRRFFGALLQTAEDGYDYIKSQVVARGLPFNDQRVNIVGIRGMQGGTLHTDVGVGLAASTFDDTFFVMCLDEGGAKMIREFRGTTEPGGRSSEFRREHPDEYGPTEQNATVRDHDVETMEADQQVVYHFTTTDTSKLGRPTLTPRVETADGDPLVVAPHRTGAATSTEADATHDGDADALAVPPVDGDPRLRDRLRTRRGREVLDRSLGIAIHSGGADDTVDAESTGCQVVQGDWYGDFIATIQRGLTAARVRAGERVRPGHPATEGDVLYSLLQASDLARDEATMRAAIAGMRAPRQETGAAVDGDGGAAAG